ncbi:hypothetical protein HY632_02275 [Candidatus Uhrbacteria bacterium]|nr:hypothetical protein [Candidatus Uhrbacteria bacterium]
MPVTIRKKGGKYEVRTPQGIKAKGTTKTKAEAQKRLLEGIESGKWRPTGQPGRKRATHT